MWAIFFMKQKNKYNIVHTITNDFHTCLKDEIAGEKLGGRATRNRFILTFPYQNKTNMGETKP